MIFGTCLLLKTVGKAPTSEMTVVARDMNGHVGASVVGCESMLHCQRQCISQVNRSQTKKEINKNINSQTLPLPQK